MKAMELSRLVWDMRRAQRRYFRERTQEALEESKRLEREVDVAVDATLMTPMLFDTEGGNT